MSIAVVEDIERERKLFCERELMHANNLDRLKGIVEKAQLKYESLKEDYEALKQCFINAGYKVDDSDGLNIYKTINW